MDGMLWPAPRQAHTAMDADAEIGTLLDYTPRRAQPQWHNTARVVCTAPPLTPGHTTVEISNKNGGFHRTLKAFDFEYHVHADVRAL